MSVITVFKLLSWMCQFYVRRLQPVRYVRAFRNCHWDDVRSCLSTAPWSVMEVYDDVNDMWEYFYGILRGCLDSYIPLKAVRNKYSKRPTPWLNSTLLHAIKLKYKAKRLADRTQDPVDISQYKMIKNNLKSQIRSAKLGYLHSLLVRARQVPQFAAGTLWSAEVNNIGRQVIHPSVIDPAVSLDTINQFFRTVAIFILIITSLPIHMWYHLLLMAALHIHFGLTVLSPLQRVSLLERLDTKKSTGPDGLSALFLKQVAVEIAEPLTYL